MSEGEKLKAIELINRIQYDGGSREDFEKLERVTGDRTFWYVFDELELEGLPPEKILDLFCGQYQYPWPTKLKFQSPTPNAFPTDKGNP
jgi:hypothetical protein